MPIPTSKQIVLSTEVKQRLRDLHTDFEDGDITKKGYCKKKWEILSSVVPTSFQEKVEDLKKRFDDGKMATDAYHDVIMSTLDEMCSTSLYIENSDKANPVKEAGLPVRADSDTDIALSCDDNESHKVEDEEMENNIPGCSNKSSPRSGTRRSLRSSFDANKSSSKKNGQSKVIMKNVDVSNKKKPNSPSHAKEQPTIISLFRNEKSKSIDNGQKKTEDEPKPMEVNSLDIKEEEDETLTNREDDEGNEKKPRLSSESMPKNGTQKLEQSNVTAKPKMPPPRCSICKQVLVDNPDLCMYGGHPRDAVEEEVALVDPRLSLFTGDEVDEIDSSDERPQNKITGFSVFDQEGHLCPFDSGLIEKNVLLYFSGYLKAIYEENKDIEGGIPVKDLGPINEWWVSGFDGGESVLIGFSTGFGDYILMEPSAEYAPFMDAVKEKIFMSKITTVPPENMPSLTEDGLLRHAQFICDQVLSFDKVELGEHEAGSSEMQESLLTSPCMRSLINLAGVSFVKRQKVRRGIRKDLQLKKKVQWTKATTTLLVKEVFENFFREQIQLENNEKVKIQKRRRCGICEACQQPDCGTCSACKDMIKFGGSGRSKQACVSRKCPNLAIQEAEDSEPEDEDSYQKLAEARNDCPSPVKTIRNHLTGSKKTITWIGDPIFKSDIKTYYKEALVEGVGKVELGSHVLVQPKDPSTPYFIARINNMWGDNNSRRIRGSETVLGETADPTEVFCIDECEDVSLRAIAKKVKVLKYQHPENWYVLGGEVDGSEIRKYFESEGKCEEKEEILWFQKRYDKIHGRFEDLLDDPPCPKPGTEYRYCPSCERLYLLQNSQIARVDEKMECKPKSEVLYGVVHYHNEEYRRGTFVFIDPAKVSWTTESLGKDMKKKEKQRYDDSNVDEEMYPEYYRKYASTGDEKERNVKGSNLETPTPFIIGMITEIKAKQSVFNGDPRFVSASDICLDVTIFFRPEDTHKGLMATYQADLNLLYWTGISRSVAFKSVVGQCYVVYGENVEGFGDADNPRHWSTLGPNRFYFLQSYNHQTKSFSDPPQEARSIGKHSKGKGKGKGKGKKEKEDDSKMQKIEEWPSISSPLKSLDVFAGCGGLSDGLHQSGVTTTEWAIEKDEAAANAFKLNNPRCTVFSDDCNDLLRLVMDGETVNQSGQRLPLKGDVELLCGGPPCQGFSGMNRFNSRQYSLFKASCLLWLNSLIASYLSYCDYYRPRFFILENVRNFVSFKKSMVLKLTLRCLIRMGYQCSFAILQAGNYGVPQTRRRAIIFAAAPGEMLPKYPSPTHVFSPKACKLSVMVDDKRFDPYFPSSAPFRTITVRDAMSDLPEIRNGSKKEEISYGGEPLSHFQRQMRGNQEVLKDHICKEMAPIVEARMAHIPTASGSDWRDLPNIVVRLSDGNYTKKLIYSHDDKKNGGGVNGALRGVCACATGKSCDPMDRQFNTLIPWCLPHTGNRHNHWAGLYGRLEWDGFFSTTITNPEPMGKQKLFIPQQLVIGERGQSGEQNGRVLHPEQTRVVSVRECARSQGFTDTYRFYGNVLDKHRQVGNAVPPPLGAAIGREIRKCVSIKERGQNASEMRDANCNQVTGP
ncbi:DNA (cytosine-5)-methyltransferase 1 [Ladona fulva]|uniref:DNA (cytosine-5)-methyltransferase n=1 Tax=Ladona fulva TaxID=123851 RepID=A0A8K0KQS9_LADFU|nr:DNA (cytosine-5)-methyltransferase 1 [Ladona fulva]